MKRSETKPVRVEFPPLSEWSDLQFQEMARAAKRKAELLNQLADAVASNDKDSAWQISQAIFEEDRKTAA